MNLKDRIKRWWIHYLFHRSSYFDEAWYRRNCKDNIGKHEDAIDHYLDGGWRNCDPSELFSNQKYLNNNLDVRNSKYAPLEHYLLYGQREGRVLEKNSVDLANAGSYHGHRYRRTISRHIWRALYNNKIRKNRNARILVCVQLFYPKSWEEVEQYLLSLDTYHCDFIFTYQSEKLFLEILKKIQARWPSAIIMKTANEGFDIGSFYASIKGIDLEQYDIVFKIHTKGTQRVELYMYNQYFRRRDWFIYLFQGILGARTVHRTIDLLMNTPDCGLVAAENLLVEDPKHKVNMLHGVLDKTRPSVKIPERYRYVAGTCFACKAELLKEMQGRRLVFAPSKRGTFSLAHCYERAICFPMQQNGYKMYGNKVCLMRRMMRKLQSRKHRCPARERLLQDSRFDLDDEFVYRSIETREIKNYELVPLRLCDIRRKWFDGKEYLLSECAPYRYLNGDRSAYERYSQFHLENNLPPMTIERFDALIKSMDLNGFDERKIIVVNQNNVILDGQHRACYLMNKYGEEHIVRCLRLYSK